MNKRRFWAEIRRHWKYEARFDHYEIYCNRRDIPKVREICREHNVAFEVNEFVNQATVIIPFK